MKLDGTKALVTGASSGIGAAFAQRLARHGVDVVLVSRRAEELESLAETIRSETGQRVYTVPFDLSQSRSGYRLAEELTRIGLRVHTVINCAGVATTGLFGDLAEEENRRQLRVNIDATVEVSHAFLPQLLESDVGALVNVASLTAYMPVPGMAVYAASKSFVVRFTEALAHEMRTSNLTVMSLSPGPTSTEFYRRSGTLEDGVRFQTPDQVVSTALSALQRKNPPISVISGVRNRWVRRLVAVLPQRTGLRLLDTERAGT